MLEIARVLGPLSCVLTEKSDNKELYIISELVVIYDFIFN